MSNIITVDFRNDTLFAVERDDGVFVAIKPICDTLGLAWNKQLERLKRDPVLIEGMTMAVLPSPGGPQETTLLKLELVNGWLFGIDESRVKDEETRQRVLAYKRECYGVLFKHLYGRSTAASPGDLPHVIATEDARKESIRTRRQLVSEARQSYGTHSARQLWAYLGLPMVPAMTTPEAPHFPFTYTAIQKESA